MSKSLAEHLGPGFLGQREDRGELTWWVEPACWVEAARFLKEEAGYSTLSDYTAVDYLDRSPRFDVSAILLDQENVKEVRLKAMVDRGVHTLTELWPGSNWFEREIFDLFGLVFDGHPNLTRLLLPSDYQGHPLRKDYPVTGPPTSMYR